MSKCISVHGEYSEHELPSEFGEFACARCLDFDEDAALAALDKAREVAARLEQHQAEALAVVENVQRILSPSSLADYEQLGAPVGDEGGNND